MATANSAVIALEVEEMAVLPPSKAEQIRAVFLPMADQVQAFDDDYNAVMAEAAEEVTPEVSARARRLRLDIAKVRIAAEKARKALKEEYLLAGRAIDGTNNILKWAISEKEAALEAIEKHAERLEAERLEALQTERAAVLSPYVEDAEERDLAGMDEDVWDAYLAAKKQAHKDRIEAERAAEAARTEAERVAKLQHERELAMAPFRGHYEAPDTPLGQLPGDVFSALLAGATEAKRAHEAEQAKVRAEAERLAKEVAEKEAARKAELARIEAEREAERKKTEAARRAELAKIEEERRREREAAEAERRRLAELEAAERERRAKEAAEEKRRAEVAARAAKAPVKRRLRAWVESFDLPELAGEQHEVADRVKQKFSAFQAWAIKEIEEGV